jgi:hypothetical protein
MHGRTIAALRCPHGLWRADILIAAMLHHMGGYHRAKRLHRDQNEVM